MRLRVDLGSFCPSCGHSNLVSKKKKGGKLKIPTRMMIKSIFNLWRLEIRALILFVLKLPSAPTKFSTWSSSGEVWDTQAPTVKSKLEANDCPEHDSTIAVWISSWIDCTKASTTWNNFIVPVHWCLLHYWWSLSCLGLWSKPEWWGLTQLGSLCRMIRDNAMIMSMFARLNSK